MTFEDHPAWQAWADGDACLALALGQDLEDADERARLGMMACYVLGRYEESIGHYGNAATGHDGIDDLQHLYIQAMLRTGDYQGATEFSKGEGLGAPQYLIAEPSAPAIIPFVDDPITEFFPGLPASVNGQATTAHVDTGGTFVHMHPDRARKFGIALTEAGTGKHGARTVPLLRGTARSFCVGPIEMRDVPVVGMPSLSGGQDYLIFGTSILEGFLTTIDYPGRRLLLSPRGRPEDAARHLAQLPSIAETVPFLMWGDHYMVAQGRVGAKSHVNFFIDSGLVSLHPQGDGTTRQAAFACARSDLDRWGAQYTPTDQEGVVEIQDAIGLGSLAQRNHIALAREQGIVSRFGGMRIDGLLSHAYLRAYAWTIDFDERCFRFHDGAKPPVVAGGDRPIATA